MTNKRRHLVQNKIMQLTIHIYKVVQTMAQSLWHHNFANVHHRVMQFSAQCSKRNSLHD